jgi:HPt (histidine-containing phosphotransfer) domain-containing protein
MRVAEICKELETAARAQQMDRAPELASDLKDAFSAACGVFQTEIHKRAA